MLLLLFIFIYSIVLGCIRYYVYDMYMCGLFGSNNNEPSSSVDNNTYGNDFFNVMLDNNISNTILPRSEATNIFNMQKTLRLNMYYHNISFIVLSTSIYRSEVVTVGSIKLLHREQLDSNTIYVGILVTFYNIRGSYFVGDIVRSNNVNFTLLMSMPLETIRVIAAPHNIVFNRLNKYGLGLCDIIIIPNNIQFKLIYENIHDMAYIHSTIIIKYYGYLLLNNMSRNSIKYKDVLNIIHNKYINDLRILNNSSDILVVT